ncbi:MAG: hypothetical protein ABR595_06945 [Psychroflexus sp.]
MKSIYALFLILIFVFAACQSDDFELELDPAETLESSDQLTRLLNRASQNPTALDDFIDGSSATKIVFPFSVNINNEQINLSNEADYQDLIAVLENASTAPNIELQFPLEVSLVNYENRNIQDATEFETVIAEAEDSSEINCVDFEFPLRVNFFNSESEFSDSVNLQNKAQLFNFIENLSVENGFYEFDFPIEMEFESQIISINSFTELESAFNDLNSNCYEPLLYEFEPEQPDLIPFLTEGEFIIVNFVDEGNNDTEDFENFTFTFNTDNSITVTNTTNQDEFFGSWDVEFDDGIQKLDLVFSDEFLDELDEDWDVVDFANPNQLELFDEPNSELEFEKL